MPNNTVVVTRPILDDCNFNACNPIVYTLRREDYQYNQINNNGGFAQIQINSTDLTLYFLVGDSVYIEGLGAATITASSFSTNTLVTVDIAFTATSTGFINNNSQRTDYKIEVEVFDFFTNIALGPRIVTDPQENGEVKVDVAGMVKTFLSAEWELPTVNEVEPETFKKIYIKYQEFYDITYWTEQDDSGFPIVAVFGFIPLLLGTPPDFTRYLYGGNLLQFYPEDDTKKFLTRFSPSLWRGWPFTISFIWGQFSDINRRVKQYDSEGVELSDTTTALTPDVSDQVHRMVLGDIDADATELVISLENGGASSPEAITEELTVYVKDPCPSQVLLFWKNCLGGDQWWMFDESQEYEFNYPNGRKVNRMKLFSDNLLIPEWTGINEMHSPSEVIALNIVDYGMDDSINKTHFRNDNQVYIVTQDLIKVGVIVHPRDAGTKTIYKKHAIEITIELPELFTV